jgi:diacylglycerol kinase (ATP)
MIMSSLQRLFSGMRPFWGVGAGGLRYTHMASNAYRLPRSLPGILRGKPAKFVTEENGYVSRNASCIELKTDCGFTVDGELFAPVAGQQVEISADHAVQFVRT